ncbi:epidermal growth factor-like protein [Euwallacea similis]|uniref:epidermal growth factor-like protein n=1 Tax=Euwallacea similis TaxID=1736056 RepID=UPI0034510134
MWNSHVSSGVAAVMGFLLIAVSGQQFSSLQHQNNSSKAGVCVLEVPTIDIIAPEDRIKSEVPRGNGSRPDLTKIEICCSGYERIPHTFIHCKPICDKGCENGNCTAPNVCTCKRNYIKLTTGDQNKCIPTCPEGCLNGVCTNNGECNCNYGYSHSPDRKYCIAVCSGGCGSGGQCIGPETCTCSPGFHVNRDTNKCEHFCEGGCGQGTCIGPNRCSCHGGYVLKENRCVAECPRGCTNGVCSAPNTCTCSQGWTLDKSGTICQPHCSSPCLNGDCVAPERCACKKGYIEAAGSAGHKCVAYCPDGCENGVCSAPNFCICNQGFMKEFKGSNRCVRRVRRSSLTDLHWELIPDEMLQGH